MLLLICLGASKVLFAQDSSGIRISLITCGPGLDLYSGFGHSAIRVIDSTIPKDVVYNYGTFNFGDPDFYSKFTRGKLLYYLNRESFREFLYTYQVETRAVYEQVFELNYAQKINIIRFLDSNAQENAKYYKYDFLYDNCSTRILAIFKHIFPAEFKPGTAIVDKKKSFRDFTNYYLRNNHWTRFGINLLLGSPVDKKMTNEQAMFLPDYLMEGFREASLNDRSLVSQTIEILPERLDFTAVPNQARMTMWLIALVVLLLWLRRSDWMIYFDTFFFLLIGLLGSIMLFMWFGTDHQACGYNMNLLWALPTHLFFAFLLPRHHRWVRPYARMAFYVLLVALVLNLWSAQQFVAELTPIILLLLWRLHHYKRSPEKSKFYANFRTMFSQVRGR